MFAGLYLGSLQYGLVYLDMKNCYDLLGVEPLIR